MFGFGLVMYLINKEIYIFGPETVHATVAIGLLVYTIKKFGPSIAAYADRQREVGVLSILRCRVIIDELLMDD